MSKTEFKTQPLFTWRSAISSPGGPEHPTTRHVLLVISLYMSEKGEGAFPSMDTLAENTGLSLRSIKKHIPIADQTGWLQIVKKSGSGQGWKRNDYKAVIPPSYYKKVEDTDKMPVQEVHHEGGEPNAPPSNNVVHLVPKGGASKRKNVVQEVHLNTPYNSSKNSYACARANGVQIPEKLQSIEGFSETYEKYCQYMKQQYRSWPNSFTTETDFQKLLKLLGNGNNPIDVINQTIQGRNKTFFPIRNFQSDDKKTNNRKSHKEFNPEQYLENGR